MKISFITTVLNEEKTIVRFLDSLISQSKMPHEIIIADGGSTDKTLEKISNFTNLIGNKVWGKKVKFKIIIKKGNIATGRNEAIKSSKGDIIVGADAGCVLDKDWIKKITEPFDDKHIHVVAGFYRPVVRNLFEKCLSCYTCVMADRVDPQAFLPSSRSIAFRKKAWEEVGGYPEHLDTCEDLVFARNLKRKGFKFVFVPAAVVYWQQRKNLREAFAQFFRYARGDGEAGYFRLQTPLLFARYLIGLSLVFIFFVFKSVYLLFAVCFLLFSYFVWAIGKNYGYVRRFRAIFILPVLQLVADIAVIAGITIGLAKRIFPPSSPEDLLR